MNKIFSSDGFFEIPDGTLLSPFLNPKDSMSNLPFDTIDGFSIAMGIIKESSSSKIHVHPNVNQATFVLSGQIILKMKGVEDTQTYTILLKKNQCALTLGGEYFQLINTSDKNCTVLYIVSPPYFFEKKEMKLFMMMP